MFLSGFWPPTFLTDVATCFLPMFTTDELGKSNGVPSSSDDLILGHLDLTSHLSHSPQLA
jgi:hypothetical protein